MIVNYHSYLSVILNYHSYFLSVIINYNSYLSAIVHSVMFAKKSKSLNIFRQSIIFLAQTQDNDSVSPDMSIGFDEFDFDLLHLTSDLQSKASSKPESSSDSDLESESSELIMFFGLQKFPSIVYLLLLVR